MTGHSVSLKKNFGRTFKENEQIYEVTSYGTTLEFKQMFSEEEAAYNKSKSGDTKLYKHTQSTGHKTILKQKTYILPQMRVTMSQILKEASNVKNESKGTTH